MLQPNHPNIVARAKGTIADLQLLLKGHGTGGMITPDAPTEDGKTLRDWLVGLQGDIETFLGPAKSN